MRVSSKAKIVDVIKDETNYVGIDMVVVNERKYRAEISSQLGFHVATLVLADKKIQILLPIEKKFYHGSASPESLKTLLKSKMDPENLAQLMLQIPLTGWSCRRENGVLAECQQKEKNKKVNWTKVEEEERVRYFDASMQFEILIKSREDLPAIQVDIFDLIPPADFKKYQIK